MQFAEEPLLSISRSTPTLPPHQGGDVGTAGNDLSLFSVLTQDTNARTITLSRTTAACPIHPMFLPKSSASSDQNISCGRTVPLLLRPYPGVRYVTTSVRPLPAVASKHEDCCLARKDEDCCVARKLNSGKVIRCGDDGES